MKIHRQNRRTKQISINPKIKKNSESRLSLIKPAVLEKKRIMVLLSAKMFVLTSYYTFFCDCKQESRVLMRLGEGIHLNPEEE